MNKAQTTEPKEASIIYCSHVDYEEMKVLRQRDPIDERIKLIAVEWCEPGAVYILFTDGTNERVDFMKAIKDERS